MELHDTLRELVGEHGPGILGEATGFRGVLDDVLDEDQASTGDINLLVDAVRFDVLSRLAEMLDGGADPGRAVEEAGLRLARERGGDDQAAASWASAVLGYAVGKVPEAVVVRYRSARPAASYLPPPATGPAPPASPAAPAAPLEPTRLPPTPVPASPPIPSTPPAPAGPPVLPPAAPSYAGYSPAKQKRSPAVWIAAAVAVAVVVGGGIAVLASLGGDDDPKRPKAGPSESSSPTVEVDVDDLAERYEPLASKIAEGAQDCAAGEPGAGQAEVVECAVETGTLRLTTYDDPGSFAAARTKRFDYRAGTLSADNGATALYEFDPERGSSSDPAIVYWDSRDARQSAEIEGKAGVTIDDLVGAFTATSPRVAEPTAPAHAKLREFIGINIDVSTCTRQRTFFTGETEESSCQANVDGIVVNVGRYRTRKALKADRKYYKGKYDEATTQGSGGTWRFGTGPKEGGYYAYLSDNGQNGQTATLYWDWNSGDCYCYGVAWAFDGDLEKLEQWWPSDD